ncbi:trichohyalin-like isoform X3 [Chlorella sorokiniana]|uniref:Trichohyalin-like isoform X3 n=1 Tax=Chlorella sorokiniana TaxID=3076 RepID=A0A2P6TLY7_CHLSO|nr:trichohyalin-like isoform X3 [Chlorella sorokiniana]|eukprot:PRW45347.1 trichohyalin-like isoform X3 [Chlorella sorokiniana]
MGLVEEMAMESGAVIDRSVVEEARRPFRAGSFAGRSKLGAEQAREKAEMLDQIGATVNELGCDYKGGVRTQGLSSDQYNLAYADPRKIDTKSYGPEYSTPGAAPAGEPAAPGGHLDLRRRGGLLHLTQSIWLTSELELTFGGGAAAGAVCDEGGGCGRGPNGEPLLLLPVTDVMLHKDCQGSYLARNRWSKTARLIPNCPPGSRAAAIADYSRQLRKLFVESPAAPKLVVLMGQGSDSGNFWQKRVAAGSVPDVGGRVVDISAEVAPLLLAHLRRGEGYEALAAALEADLGLCGGLAAPFAVVWLRPGSLNPLLILSSVHGCSDQWRVDQAPRGVVEVHAFLSLLGGRELPPHSALPKTSPGLTRADKRIIGTQYYGCMGCLLALNLQLTADGAKPLAKGLQCCYACEHAGIDGLPLKQKRHMYSIHLQQRYAEPTVLSELSSSAATQAFVASAQALAAARQRGDEAQAALRSTWMQLLLPEAAGEEQHAAVLERQRAAEARQRAIEQRQQAERLERQEATAKRRREAALASGERAAQQRAAALSAAQAEYAAAEADGTAEALAEDGWDAAPLEMDAAEVAAAHRAAGNAWRLQAAEERRQQRAAAAAERRRAAEQRRQQQAAAAAEQWRVAALASGEWASQQRAAALSAAQAEYAAAEEDGTAEALAEDGWEVAPLEMDAAEVAAAHRAAGNAWRLQAAEEWRQQQAAAAAEQRQQQAAATEELQKQQQAAATEELQKQQQAAAAEQRQAAEAAEQRVAAQWRIVAELWRGSNLDRGQRLLGAAAGGLAVSRHMPSFARHQHDLSTK